MLTPQERHAAIDRLKTWNDIHLMNWFDDVRVYDPAVTRHLRSKQHREHG